MTDLVERLRALSRTEHDNLSIGEEAALELLEARGYGDTHEAMALHMVLEVER